MSYTIHVAAAQGDTLAIETILMGFPEQLNAPGPDGLSPLCCALRCKRKTAVEFILVKGANVGVYEIAEAARTGCPEFLEMLVKYGADVNMVGSRGMTPVQVETTRMHSHWENSVKLLLEAGAEANTRNQHPPPLLMAVKNPDIGADYVELLLQHGADPNAKDSTGCTPLYYASLYGRSDLAQVLLRYDGKIENSGRSWQPSSPHTQDMRFTVYAAIIFIFGLAVFAVTYFK